MLSNYRGDFWRLIRWLASPIFKVSWLVFGLSLFATLLAWRFFVVSIDGTAKNAFDDLLLAFTGELERSMTAYEQVLSGAASLVQTNPTISRRDFRRYLDVVQVTRRYPGQQGIGYSVMFPANQLATVEQRVRDEGFENFKVTPQGNRKTYSAIIFIEPFDWRNKRAFGYDMYSEPVRRTAMARARDTGLPAASGAVKLVQETKSDIQAGFLLYLPIYSGFQMPDTVEERRQTIKGFVYSPFRIGNLVEAVLKRERLDIKSNADIRITAPVIGDKTDVIYDDAKDSGDANHQAKFVQKGFLELYGVRWDIALASTPKFERAVDYTPAWAALFVGLTLSVLLSGLVGSAALRQHEANMSNARMELLTRELAHRVKNSLAVVQSVANRSLVDGRPLKEARELFLQRLHALARAHSHLVNNSWRGVSMRELTAAELQPFGARASIHGPDVSMNANTAQMFALVLHELATNAVKHGALSVPAGRVDLRWRIVPVDGEDTLRFRWKEAGGPAVNEPESSGFGQTLLKQSIAHGGLSRPEIAYEKDGLLYEFDVPLARLEEETSLRSSK